MSSAPIYAQSDTQPAADAPAFSLSDVGDGAAWATLDQPADTREFCASWLSILCTQVARVRGGVVLLGEQDNTYVPVAFWPDASRNLTHLGPAAQAALTQRRGVVLAGGAAEAATTLSTYVAYPLELDGRLEGAVALDIATRPEQEVQGVLRLVHWGSAWLLDHFRQRVLQSERRQSARLMLATEILATALHEPRLGEACLGVVNELAGRLDCQRVALGFEHAGSIKVQAISHSASFDARTDAVRLLADVMDEVWDLDIPVVHPPLQDDGIASLSHMALSASRHDCAVLSVPLRNGAAMVGVLTFERERDRLFTADDMALCSAVGSLLGPALELKRENERGVWQRMLALWRHGAVSLFGPGHPGLKLLALLLICLALFFSLASGAYRVSARTVVEGKVQRAMSAPFSGFVAESHARAGDRVTAGQVLAKLDDRELQLERLRWQSEVEQALRRYRQAAAGSDRASMAVLSAQIDQAQAQLTLTEDRLSRALLVAPFDGVVVHGDLSQQLGSPVEQGKLLFEVAPLDAYRIILQVDERDIGEIQVGQGGELALSGLPYQRMAFTVERIMPISVPLDGRNHFRVESRLHQADLRLRPGMEGVGKVDVGDRRLLWIWTHSFVDWLRLWTWKWFG